MVFSRRNKMSEESRETCESEESKYVLERVRFER
jgi:hypothetical protein